MINSLLFDLVESCTITRRAASGSDELGQPTYSTSTKTSACRFDISTVSGAGGEVVPGPDISGQFIAGAPYVFLPPTADVKIGDTISSSVSEFEGPYKVVYVKTITGLFSTSVDHFEVFLEQTKKGGA